MRRRIRQLLPERVWRRGQNDRPIQPGTLQRAEQAFEKRDSTELDQSGRTVDQDNAFMTHASFLNNRSHLGKPKASC
jgi:hypothetical protein